MRVRVTKIGPIDDPNVPTPVWEGYRVGEDNGNDVSLPSDYVIEGEMIGDEPKLNQCVLVARDKRNGVCCMGIFRTTQLRSVAKTDKGYKFETTNSRYILEKL